MDLLTSYATADTGIGLGESDVCVVGDLLDATPFQGCDRIVAVSVIRRCGLGFELALVLAPMGWLYGRRRRRLA